MKKHEFIKSQTVALYGAGNTGRDVMQLLSHEGMNVGFFMDANAPLGGYLSGIPVYAPENVPLDVRRAEIPVVVSIFNRDVDVAEIMASLRSRGWRTVISFTEFHAWYAAQLGDRFWLTTPSVLDKEASRIADVSEMWTDDKSREVYSAILASRRSGKVEDMPRPNPGEVQYFPSDIKGWLPDLPLRFVDCGAYDGDTLRAIKALRLRVGAYAAFEPDMDNFKKLCMSGREMFDPETTVHLWPCGVSSHAEYIAFACGMGEASHLSGDGAGLMVPCVGLDEVLSGFRPNMVKMDIEGAEPSAVAGASRLIVENHPRLAISLYHCPDHLWAIPLAIATLYSGYKMYLRVYGYNLLDVVLYAVPEPFVNLS